MNLQQLREVIQFEAKIPGTRAIDGWLNQTIVETARQITAMVRYPELFVSDHQVTLTAAQSSFTLPADVQHIARESFRYAVGGSKADQYGLIYRQNFSTLNSGRLRYISRAGSLVSLYPYGLIVAGDTLLFNYWKYPLTALDTDILNPEIIQPEVIIAELKARVMARAVTFVDAKQVPIYRNLAIEQRAANLAQTDLDDVND